MKWQFDERFVNPGDVWYYPWENQNAVRANLSRYAVKNSKVFVTHKVGDFYGDGANISYLKVEYIGPRDEGPL